MSSRNDFLFHEWKQALFLSSAQWRIQGEGPDPPPHQSWRLFDTNSYIGRVVYHFFLVIWLIFPQWNGRCTLPLNCIPGILKIKPSYDLFAKQNFPGVLKNNCFWLPSYELLAKQSFLRQRSQIEKHVVVSSGKSVICHKKVQQSFLNQSLDPPLKYSWIRLCCLFTCVSFTLDFLCRLYISLQPSENFYIC